MKFLHKILLLGAFLLISSNCFGQVENLFKPTESQIAEYIDEAYKGHANQLIYSKPNRLRDTQNLLIERITIFRSSKKGIQGTLISKMPLFNKFNGDLKRDLNIDPSNFNPLKYDLDFYSGYGHIYRMDGTDLYLKISPQTFTNASKSPKNE